ncbi:hypothetical protein VHEMI04302 [[Torrubiella] hemipterigena]|uniref:Glutathione S-transferase n=1 Tax=[Torrubiella] hemipterigena TaxID=1531966 RepID=A0A0A1SUX5_9HYPO|nr:hypothetical protein VHEMI04302 [[Torrubiella] hemipterigena]
MEVTYHKDTPDIVRNAQGLQLFTENTNNGKKVQILIEELKEAYGTECHIRLVDLEAEEQKKDWFRVLNPGGKIPTLIDDTFGAPVSVIESTAILVHLQEHHDKDNLFGFTTPAERSQMSQWLFFWHNAASVHGHGRFFIASPDAPPAARDRFSDHIRRIYTVLETHLSGKHSGTPREYLAGKGAGRYSIADIGAWAHLKAHKSLGISDEEMKSKFSSLAAWIDKISARPAVQKGIDGNKYDSSLNVGALVAAEK